MTRSLKSCIPELAPILDQSEAALYERQRALVREGLIKSRPGHGRGSGVEASPETMAILLIGVLSSLSLSEAGPRARRMAAARGEVCGLTGADRFKDALTQILTDESLAKRVREIVVGVTLNQAIIRYDKTESSVFVGERTRKPQQLGVQFVAHIPGKALQKIAKLIRSADDGEIPA